MENISIRSATRDDLGEIIALTKPMWVEHGLREPKFLRKIYLEKYDSVAYFEPCFSPNTTNHLLVAENNEHIVGCVRGEEIEVDGMFVTQKAIYVDDLVVRDTYRGKGLGKLLLSEIEKLAKNNEIKLLKTRIYSFNSPAQRLAQKQGFRNLYSECFKVLE